MNWAKIKKKKKTVDFKFTCKIPISNLMNSCSKVEPGKGVGGKREGFFKMETKGVWREKGSLEI